MDFSDYSQIHIMCSMKDKYQHKIKLQDIDKHLLLKLNMLRNWTQLGLDKVDLTSTLL